MDGTMEPWKTVIGVVPDAVSDLLRTEGDPFVYEPLAWRERLERMTTLLVRLPGVDAMSRLRTLATSVRPDQAGTPATRFENMRETLDITMAEPRFTMGVLVAFAVVGVTLAAIGLFGVISYSVRRRTREIGVRMALGATRPVVARLVVGEALRLALAGIVLGLVGAAVGSRLLQGMLYGVERLDPFAFGVGALALLVVAVVACLAPMWRATGIDPIAATRAD
jgi:ABC-type antimicrobial peptide transport system permease subunit